MNVDDEYETELFVNLPSWRQRELIEQASGVLASLQNANRPLVVEQPVDPQLLRRREAHFLTSDTLD